MIINVSFDGRKLFNWEGGIAEATKIEKDVSEVAALGNMSPETLWQSTLAKIAANGRALASRLRNNNSSKRAASFFPGRAAMSDRGLLIALIIIACLIGYSSNAGAGVLFLVGS